MEQRRRAAAAAAAVGAALCCCCPLDLFERFVNSVFARRAGGAGASVGRPVPAHHTHRAGQAQRVTFRKGGGVHRPGILAQALDLSGVARKWKFNNAGMRNSGRAVCRCKDRMPVRVKTPKKPEEVQRVRKKNR
eukprot:gene12060-biopygen18451